MKATWKTYFRQGNFACELAVESDNAASLMAEFPMLLETLAQAGAEPSVRQAAAPTAKPAGPTGDGWCKKHNCQMKLFSKGDHSWYSHQTEEGAWCRG